MRRGMEGRAEELLMWRISPSVPWWVDTLDVYGKHESLRWFFACNLLSLPFLVPKKTLSRPPPPADPPVSYSASQPALCFVMVDNLLPPLPLICFVVFCFTPVVGPRGKDVAAARWVFGCLVLHDPRPFWVMTKARSVCYFLLFFLRRLPWYVRTPPFPLLMFQRCLWGRWWTRNISRLLLSSHTARGGVTSLLRSFSTCVIVVGC